MQTPQSEQQGSSEVVDFVDVSKSRMEELQDTMEKLLTNVISGGIDLERAKLANEIGRTLINSAKVETDFFVRTQQTAQKAMCMPRANVQQKRTSAGTLTKRTPSGNGLDTLVHQLGG